MNNVRFLDWLGSAAFTIALLSVMLLFVPGLVRADGISSSDYVTHTDMQNFIGRADL